MRRRFLLHLAWLALLLPILAACNRPGATTSNPVTTTGIVTPATRAATATTVSATTTAANSATAGVAAPATTPVPTTRPAAMPATKAALPPAQIAPGEITPITTPGAEPPAPTAAPAPPGAAAPTPTAAPRRAATRPGAGVPTPQPTATTTLAVQANAQHGQILTDAAGLTLYTYAKDPPNTSACVAACAQTWKPLLTTATPTLPPGVSGTLGTLARADGGRQVTYNGRPLYTYVRDTRPGQAQGDGAGNGAWHIATPAAP
ncbi:MAG: COG4315 family predicted lipoprotein [Thermomicrobiales bacterium]